MESAVGRAALLFGLIVGLSALVAVGRVAASTELGAAISVRFVGECDETAGYWYTTLELPDGSVGDASITPVRWSSGTYLQLDAIGPSSPDGPYYFVLVDEDGESLLYVGRFEAVITPTAQSFELDVRLDCTTNPYTLAPHDKGDALLASLPGILAVVAILGAGAFAYLWPRRVEGSRLAI